MENSQYNQTRTIYVQFQGRISEIEIPTCQEYTLTGKQIPHKSDPRPSQLEKSASKADI